MAPTQVICGYALGCIDILSKVEPCACESDCGLEADTPFAVSGGDSSELLESVEAAFDAISEFVQRAIMRPLLFPATAGRDHSRGPEVVDSGHDGVGVVPLVGQFDLCLAAFKERQRLGIFRGLACRKTEADRFSESVGQQVDLGAQSTSGTPQSLVFAPFLRPVAAC